MLHLCMHTRKGTTSTVCQPDPFIQVYGLLQLPSPKGRKPRYCAKALVFVKIKLSVFSVLFVPHTTYQHSPILVHLSNIFYHDKKQLQHENGMTRLY